jgi:3-carboxy-cis,cis-muconate cycloisomerase
MSVAPFDHPLLSGLLGDDEVARQFSAATEISAMLAFEAALAEAEAAEGIIPAESARAIIAAAAAFKPDLAALKTGATRDGVVVPELVRQLRGAVGEPHGRHVHFGATSQDVVDTALTLRLLPLLNVFDARMARLVEALVALAERDGDVEVMAHTRMQAAIPVPASRKITSWLDPMLRQKERLVDMRTQLAMLHFGGAAGTLEKLGDKADAVTRNLAQRLNLRAMGRPRHSERDTFGLLASHLSVLTGALGKMGADIALGAQTEVGEIRLASGGGSSAMPHKVNPVGAETLVTLARFNATLVSGMHQALVHENERSGAAWTLEWMLLPQMLAATGAALRTALDLVPAIRFARK